MTHEHQAHEPENMNQLLLKSPFAHENWLATRLAQPCYEAFEFPLYSDARVEGASDPIDGSPYSFLNGRAWVDPGPLLQVLFVRAEIHVKPSVPNMQVTDVSTFHGGWLPDELAALASLALGIRLRAGTITRWFDAHDPLGEPVADRAPPLPPQLSRARSTIPQATRTQQLRPLKELMSLYPDATPEKAIALVRAAQLYSDALWVADSQTNLAWMFLVAAVEAAATQSQFDSVSSADLLAISYPRLVAELRSEAGERAVDITARHLARLLRAKGRFLDFLLRYLPAPPPSRPPGEFARVSWDPGELKSAFAKIYDYRSSALHNGTPFPSPMCEAPRESEERPGGLVMSIHGSVWHRDDLPMFLHIFEHVVRGALVNWWRDKATKML